MNAIAPIDECLDMIIVGAGISGIGMAVHMQRDCPDKRFAILERRDQIGGTWDLFRYPGIRSDSDMHTLGFSFAPWKHEKSIADGPAILDYLNDIADQYDLRRRMRFGQKVISADWDSKTARWTLICEQDDGSRQQLQARRQGKRQPAQIGQATREKQNQIQTHPASPAQGGGQGQKAG